MAATPKHMSTYDPVTILDNAIATYGCVDLYNKIPVGSDFKNLFDKAYELFDTKVKQSYEFIEPKEKVLGDNYEKLISGCVENGNCSLALHLCNECILTQPVDSTCFPDFNWISDYMQSGRFFLQRAKILESLGLFGDSLQDYWRSKNWV